MHVQIMSEELNRQGLVPGPWLSVLKSAVMGGEPSSKKIRVKTLEGMAEYSLGELEGGMFRWSQPYWFKVPVGPLELAHVHPVVESLLL